MSISSFDTDFIIDSQKAADSLTKIISTNHKSIEIDRTLTCEKKEREGQEKFRQILMQQSIAGNENR